MLLEVSRSDVQRMESFRSSSDYSSAASSAYSPYWRHHSARISTSVMHDSAATAKVEVAGDSGFYIPPPLRPRQSLQKVKGLAGRSIEALRVAYEIIVHQGPRSPVWPSFDRAYSQAISEIPGIEATVLCGRPFPRCAHDVRLAYEAWSRRRVTPHILLAYYFLGLLLAHGSLGHSRKNVLEVGPGSGNLASLILHYFPDAKVTLVDLPETMQLSFFYLRSLFPNRLHLLPNELSIPGAKGANCTFLTPAQLGVLSDTSIDLAVNIHSFQEMLYPQIDAYFSTFDRVLAHGGHSLIVNRAEKSPTPMEVSSDGSDCIRFGEYPWPTSWRDRLYLTSAFHRLVQPDNVFIRVSVKEGVGVG